MKPFKAGSKVQWKWLGRTIAGVVTEIHLQPVAKKIKETAIKRNGSATNPAYLVLSEAGNFALKLHSELQVPDAKKTSNLKPKMFKS